MRTKQTDTAAMTEEQLDAVAGGVMPDENGRPCTDPRRRRWCFPIPFPSFPFPISPFPAPDPREVNDGTTRGRR